MLVLTRKSGEQIVCGSITITICRIQGEQVRVGVEAPEDVPIARKELADRIARHGARKRRLAVFGESRERPPRDVLPYRRFRLTG